MIKTRMISLLFLVFTNLLSCQSENQPQFEPDTIRPPDSVNTETPASKLDFYYGADLSYINEMIDCGAIYRNSQNVVEDPYSIFSNAGTNLVRVRLWHNPTWTNYSDYQDVLKTIRKAKEAGMQVLLDFHYSDTWTDPAKQQIPAAWKDAINDKEKLGSLLYEYTYKILTDLAGEQLLPEIVQVGNEINPMILQGEELVWPIDWDRNAYLINKGIEAVRQVSEEQQKEVGVMLHIAQPENALWWFKEATENGITDYDWIGLSYYPIWSEYDLNTVGPVFKTLINEYKKRLMVVETAYPFTMDNADTANNILDNEALISGYPASQQGQLDYLNQLKKNIQDAGGEGLVYWEPGWVSTKCNTLWGQGSHWDNATLFDHNNKGTIGMEFYKH